MSESIGKTSIDFNNFLKPDYGDLDIFASPYFYNVIAPIYDAKLESKSEKFSLVFGDFDKLNYINTKYGFKAGNQVMHDILSIIRSNLPEDAVISRIGGDEFVILIDNIDKEEADVYISKVNDIIKENVQELKGGSITLCANDSQNSESFSELYSNTHNEVSLAKLKFESKNIDPWEVLEYKIKNDINAIINTFRFSNRYEFSNKHTQYLGNALLNTAIPILKDPELLKSFKNDNNSHKPSFNAFGLDNKELLSIYNSNGLLASQSSEAKIQNVINSLVVNPHTGLFGAPYFNNYILQLLKDSDMHTKIIYFSVSGLKISNTINGYEYTDEQLKKISGIIQESINELLSEPICNTPFNDELNSNYLFDMRGGNFLALITEDSNIGSNEINSIVENCNESAFSLGVVSSSKDNVKSSDLLNCIASLNKDCEEKKIHLKDKALNSDTLDSIIKHCISDCVEFYVKSIPDYQSDAQKRIFLDKLFHTSLEIMVQNNRNIIQNPEETQK